MKKLLVLLLLCALLTGCAAKPDIEGKWVTSLEDTLCATVLIIEGGRFTLIQEGQTQTGSIVDDGGYIILRTDPLTPGDSGSAWSAPYDLEAGTLLLWGQTLHRE